MSIESDAQVQFILADYASIDASGKLNIIGGGIIFIGSGGPGQPSARFTTVVIVRVPAEYANQTYAFSLELKNLTTGGPVMIPAGAGQLQPVRAQQAITVPPVQVPAGKVVPEDALQGHTTVLEFDNGLLLTAGHSFEWQVQINGHADPGWTHRFHVLGDAPGPVFGGPNGPTTIPGVRPPFPDTTPD
jgi:hypothetical protein